jgi:hypothetical protein
MKTSHGYTGGTARVIIRLPSISGPIVGQIGDIEYRDREAQFPIGPRAPRV